MKQLLYSFIFIALLSGCAAKSVSKDVALNDESKEGLIVLSISHELTGGRNVKAIFHLDGGSLSGGQTLHSLGEVAPAIPRGSEFKDSYGQLLVLSLSPGKHTIDSWQIANNSGLRILPGEKPAPLEFEVMSGQVKYLGNLHANLVTGKNIIGVTLAGDGYPEVRDQQQRDIPVFESRYPQFRGKAVVDLLKLGPWYDQLETRKRIDPMPVIRVKK